MEESDKNSVGLSTGWFGLSLSGKDAGYIFLFLVILASTGLNAWFMSARDKEHSEIVCMIKLNLFVNQSTRGGASGEILDWQRMPVDLYTCVPRFLYEKSNHDDRSR